MLRFAKLAHRPRTLYRMTGLTPERFSLLSNRLKPVWKEAERERLSRPDRKRAIGAGRLYALSTLEDKLLALLMFYRFYLTDELMEWICGLDKSNVCRLRWPASAASGEGGRSVVGDSSQAPDSSGG